MKSMPKTTDTTCSLGNTTSMCKDRGEDDRSCRATRRHSAITWLQNQICWHQRRAHCESTRNCKVWCWDLGHNEREIWSAVFSWCGGNFRTKFAEMQQAAQTWTHLLVGKTMENLNRCVAAVCHVLRNNGSRGCAWTSRSSTLEATTRVWWRWVVGKPGFENTWHTNLGIL